MKDHPQPIGSLTPVHAWLSVLLSDAQPLNVYLKSSPYRAPTNLHRYPGGFRYAQIERSHGPVWSGPMEIQSAAGSSRDTPTGLYSSLERHYRLSGETAQQRDLPHA